MNQALLTIQVKTETNMSNEQLQGLLEYLLAEGMAHAIASLEDANNGTPEEVAMAKRATEIHIGTITPVTPDTSVQVKHWAAYEHDDTILTHQFDISDQRESNGQVSCTVGSIDGNTDDLLSVTMEVDTDPTNGIDHVPCARVYFDSDAVAVLLFKMGNDILMLPETDVTITSTQVQQNGKSILAYWIK